MIMIDTILFDWDGTLLDSAQNAFDAFQKAFRELGLKLDFDTYQRIFSPDWHKMYEALELPADQWGKADELWLLHYGNAQSPVLLPGVRNALDRLVSRGATLGIVTNGDRARVSREIELLGLTDIFKVLVCGDDVAQRKPHPEGLLLAMERLGKKPEVCCYVGDCPEDIEMGKRGGVVTVAIPGLYPVNTQLREAGPDLWCESIDQFLQWPALK